MGFEHAGLDFWLSSIACHAPDAPVLIVGTQLDQVRYNLKVKPNQSYRGEDQVRFHRRFICYDVAEIWLEQVIKHHRLISNHAKEKRY